MPLLEHWKPPRSADRRPLGPFARPTARASRPRSPQICCICSGGFKEAERAASRFGLPPTLPTHEDLNLLLTYPWPGNVRELAAVMDRAALLGNGQRLAIAQALGAGYAMPAQSASAGRADSVELQAGSSSVPATGVGWLPGPRAHDAAPMPFSDLNSAMRVHIESALRKCHGRIAGPFGAARLLRINPHTLRGRMRKLKIDWRRFRLSSP